MASLTGAVVDGVYTKTDASKEATASANSNISTSKTDASSGTSYDQDMFLQLLTAEMQYQDPLEPTSNTEYVSELASFTQIEAIQAVQEDMQTLQANSLVGKYVIILHDDEYVSGKVDYVENDEGDLKVAVGDNLYDLDEIDSVVDEAYYNAVLTTESFSDTIAALPSASELTLSDESKITAARTLYDAMDTYTKSMVKSDDLSTLTTLENKLAALKKAKADAEAEETASTSTTTETDTETEETVETSTTTDNTENTENQTDSDSSTEDTAESEVES